MATRKRKARRTQGHTTQGQVVNLAKARDPYPTWPDLVDKPEIPRDKRRALGWYAQLIRHRIAEDWQPADPARLALLSCALVAVGRAMHQGDFAAARVAQTTAAQLARQLGLNTAANDPRVSSSAAKQRANQAATLDAIDDDLGLLAMPAHGAQFRN